MNDQNCSVEFVRIDYIERCAFAKLFVVEHVSDGESAHWRKACVS